MVVPVLQYEEGAAVVGGVGEGGSNCAVTCDSVQGSGTDGVALRERELGNEGCDAEGAGGVPS